MTRTKHRVEMEVLAARGKPVVWDLVPKGGPGSTNLATAI